MIKINYEFFKKTQNSGKKEEDNYYNKIKKFKFDEKTTLEERYKSSFKEKYNCNLKELLIGSFEDIESKKGTIESIDKKNNKCIKTMLGCIKRSLPRSMKSYFSTEKNKKITFLFNYNNKRKVISSFFRDNVDLHTCYFCNIGYINNFNKNNKKIGTSFTLDHYIPKGKYPHLALSFYNLVPSCYICNTLKKDDEINNVSPTSSQFNFDEKVKFKTFISKENKSFQIKKEDDFELHLKEDFSNEYKKYMEVFKLDERYQYHKNKVLEMIEKRKIYPDSRIKELAKITQRTKQEVKRDLFGDYLFEDGLHKRPLSKLIRDIAYELGLVSDLEHLKILNQE
jgi:hypothetical protein